MIPDEEYRRRTVAALERVAVANERLIELAVEERQEVVQAVEDVFVPACPACGEVDPQTRSKGGEGRLSEFVLVSPCGGCGAIFYAVPTGWRVASDRDGARALMGAS